MKKLLFLPVALFFTASRLLAQNPVPFVNQPLVPTAVAPGGSAFTLTVNGTGFVSGATVQWNGSALATSFVSSSQLTAAVPASNIATARTAEIAVLNPTSLGGGLSNVVYFPISNPTRDVVFQPGPVVSGSSGLAHGFQLAAGNFGTGKLSLIAPPFNSATGTPSASGTVLYWPGNGDGTFQSPVSIKVQPPSPSFANGNIQDVALGDFNRDGKLDAVLVGTILATGGPGPSTPQGYVAFLAGNGDGTFQPFVASLFQSTTPQLTQFGPGIAVGDINADGNLDLVVACTQAISGPNGTTTNQSGICSLLGNGQGAFSGPPFTFSRFYPFPFFVNSLVLGDFNGDGKLDIVASGGTPYQYVNPSYVGFLAGNGDGTFAPDRLVYETSDSFNGPGWIGAADLNHDSKLDLVYAHDCDGQRFCGWDADFLVGNGDGTFQAPITAHNFPSVSPPLFGDFNADGNLDVAALSAVFLLLNNNGSRAYPISQSPQTVVVGDFNGDGRLDLMAVENGPADIQPFLQVAPPPDFDVAVSSNSQTVTAGGTATFTVTITGVNGFNGVVTPSQTGFPAGTTVSYNPPTVTGSGNMVITITTSTSTPPGTYPLAGALTSGSIVHSGILTLVVN